MEVDHDIRRRSWVTHADVAALNFIRATADYRFRQHYRQGLRSVVVEVLRTTDLAAETEGCRIGGIRRFPRALPVRMLRIFRAGFASLEAALEDVGRIKLLTRYLTRRHMAVSEEVVLDYQVGGHRRIVLCGLQPFVTGTPLNPWGDLPPVAEAAGRAFVDRVKRFVAEEGLIPDLAGFGNLIYTDAERIVLVDINNISALHFDDRIHLDDKGYPVTDRSVEALFQLESRIARPEAAGRLPGETLYRHYLARHRLDRVQRFERAFSRQTGPSPTLRSVEDA